VERKIPKKQRAAKSHTWPRGSERLGEKTQKKEKAITKRKHQQRRRPGRIWWAGGKAGIKDGGRGSRVGYNGLIFRDEKNPGKNGIEEATARKKRRNQTSKKPK